MSSVQALCARAHSFASTAIVPRHSPGEELEQLAQVDGGLRAVYLALASNPSRALEAEPLLAELHAARARVVDGLVRGLRASTSAPDTPREMPEEPPVPSLPISFLPTRKPPQALSLAPAADWPLWKLVRGARTLLIGADVVTEGQLRAADAYGWSALVSIDSAPEDIEAAIPRIMHDEFDLVIVVAPKVSAPAKKRLAEACEATAGVRCALVEECSIRSVRAALERGSQEP